MNRASVIVCAAAVASVLSGCGGGTNGVTTVYVDVSSPSKVAPDHVVINVFDPHGIITTKTIAPVKLPGRLTVIGLPDTAEMLRIVAVGDGATSGHELGGVAVILVPTSSVTAKISMSSSYSDQDNDDVPDALDDCPTAPDPKQTSALGDGFGDVCQPDGGVAGGGGGGGGAGGGSTDMAIPPNSDLAGTPPADMTPVPPDMVIAASSCPNASQTGVLFCNGFESASASVTNTYQNLLLEPATPSNATVSVDNIHVYRGSNALHIKTGGGTTESTVALDETSTFGSAPNHFFIRAFVFLPSGFPTTDRTEFLFTGQNSGAFNSVRLELFNGSFSVHNLIGGTEYTDATAPTIATNVWTCVEWEVDVTNAKSVVTVNNNAGNAFSSTQSFSGVAKAGIFLDIGGDGMTHSARDFWLDELVIDSAPIGCTK